MQLLLRLAAHALAGFGLMFAAHPAAFLGSSFVLPYGWAYLVLIPIAAVGSVRLKYLTPLQAAASLFAVPVLYFFALGVSDGNWHASSNSLIGVLLASVLSFLLATKLGRARPPAGAAA